MSLEESEFMMVQGDEDSNEHQKFLPNSGQGHPVEASIVNVNGRYLEEVVLIPPSDADGSPVIWNENVCKLFVKEKTPSPLLSVKFGSKRSRGRKGDRSAIFPPPSGMLMTIFGRSCNFALPCK